MADSHDETIEPLTALEQLLRTAGPAGIAAATDAARKLVRAYARQSSSGTTSPTQAREAFRALADRALPALDPPSREALVSELAHTFVVWARR